jgi:NAD(P)H-dependent FMN reductase
VVSSDTLRLAVIFGSVRDGRFGPVPGQWFVGEAQKHGRFDIDVVDLAEAHLPTVLPPVPPAMWTGDECPPEMADLTRRLDEADAFVVVTPEYNHSFPASIKLLIDWHFTQWRAKPVGFVSYGGVGGGLRSIEHLRHVFAEMHAVTVRDTVSFSCFWELFDAEGQLREPEGPNGAAKILLDQLVWWATALRDARAKVPYQVEG